MSTAEEIADDFRHSLEYLQTPDRYAINNFTVIAKENTEHADAISNVLVEHINKAPPHHKLPALYVLDSIAKNIGTPYTLFLGHKLYNVFLTAYSSVDSVTRKKLDEMLKTWKSPVPGSITPTPVFPSEYTRKIDNALNQARNAFLKKHEQVQVAPITQKRPSSALAGTQWRNTPTPPQQVSHYPPPPSQAYFSPDQGLASSIPVSQISNVESYSGNVNQFHNLQQYSIPLTYNTVSNPAAFNTYGHAASNMNFPLPTSQSSSINSAQLNSSMNMAVDVQSLMVDIDRLISICVDDMRNMSVDPTQMSKLDALRALRNVLSTQNLPSDQLAVIWRQVNELQASSLKGNSEQRATLTPNFGFEHNQVQSSPAQNLTMIASSPSLLNGGASSGQNTTDLAALLAKASGETRTTTSDVRNRSQSEMHAATPAVSTMLASLAEKGVFSLLQNDSKENMQVPAIAQSSSLSVADLLARATGIVKPDINSSLLNLTSESLKMKRPSLLNDLLKKRPDQCVNCGLRFASSKEGRERKERHMDWHFRANQRISDASRGIQSRSWFVGELDWIKSKEMENHSDASHAEKNEKNGSSMPQNLTSAFVSVPGDPGAHQPCPVCQERFEMGFNQDIQDWVWLDAIQVGSKIYHNTCYSDLRRDGLNTRERTGTPDSFLRKRKAELNAIPNSPAKRPSLASNAM